MAGALISVLGGSRVQVSGPTAAFVVILSPVAHQFGLGGLLLATILAGALLVAMGLARMGRFIEFVPYPVTTGFTSGIAVAIGTLQIKDLLSLTVELPPLPVLPWHLPGPEGRPLVLSLGLVRELMPAAFAIAVLGAIESLLSAVVADGMTGRKHDPDVELIAQGAGNLVGPFFGGIAATGAIARTATNVRSAGRSPIAAATHSLVVLLSVLVLAPALGYLPMASLAALLLVVASAPRRRRSPPCARWSPATSAW